MKLTLAAVILFLFEPPAAEGWIIPDSNGLMTIAREEILTQNLAPGDEVHVRRVFHNDENETWLYRIVLIKQGDLWSCGHVKSTLTWSQDADQCLEPEETEVLDIQIYLPRSAGESCQAGKARLILLAKIVLEKKHAGVFECQISSRFEGDLLKELDGALPSEFCWWVEDVMLPSTDQRTLFETDGEVTR